MNSFLKTLFLFNGVFVFAGNLFGPLYTVYVEGIDNSILAISGSWAAFLISSTFFMFVLSKLGDGIANKTRILLIGFLVRAVVWILFIFTKDIYSLIIVQALLGIGEALGSPTFDTIIAEHLDKGKHIMDYADWKIVSNMLGALAVLAGGIIVQNFGFNTLFISMSLLACVSFTGVAFNLKQPVKV